MLRLIGINASAVAAAGGGFESIASSTLSSDTASVTFSTIPGTYQHLQLRMIIRGDRAATNDGLLVRFNSNTNSIYDTHFVYNTGAAIAATATTGNSALVFYEAMPAASLNANYFASHILDIHDYANASKNKTIKSFYGFDANSASSREYLASGGFRDTTAITSITLLPQNGSNFKTNSVFSLYGIKAA